MPSLRPRLRGCGRVLRAGLLSLREKHALGVRRLAIRVKEDRLDVALWEGLRRLQPDLFLGSTFLLQERSKLVPLRVR